MREPFDAWLGASRRAVAVRNDCHTPPGAIGKHATRALDGFWRSCFFTSGCFPDPVTMTPVNRRVVESACRRCHEPIADAIEGPAADPAAGATARMRIDCVACHRDVGHAHGAARSSTSRGTPAIAGPRTNWERVPRPSRPGPTGCATPRWRPSWRSSAIFAPPATAARLTPTSRRRAGKWRRAQFYLDFIEAENSTGFHAPEEAARILAEAIDFRRPGQLARRDGSKGAVTDGRRPGDGPTRD